MADATGALHHEFDGHNYSLRLTLGGIAKLQGRHGDDLGGLLSGKYDSDEGKGQKIPPFGIMIDIVAESLVKGENLPEEDARDLADDMLSADLGLFQQVLASAFPDLRKGTGQGNRKAPKAKG
ncbi:hypothetical protein [uncultured Paracoccus sp.]|uniref:hypothetical protein n=1 Tax=uncultured Paracoccus sp. TaxID=189685 RepID=UPI0025D6A9E0|nr:hypothetical protein [uncultured Paracoccus sp.]